MKRIVSSLCFSILVLLAAVPQTVVAQATHGELTVYNESGFQVTIYINSNERGVLDPGYSKCYRTQLTGFRAEARTDPKFGKQGHKDFVLTSTYPYDSWYIHNDDLN